MLERKNAASALLAWLSSLPSKLEKLSEIERSFDGEKVRLHGGDCREVLSWANLTTSVKGLLTVFDITGMLAFLSSCNWKETSH